MKKSKTTMTTHPNVQVLQVLAGLGGVRNVTTHVQGRIKLLRSRETDAGEENVGRIIYNKKKSWVIAGHVSDFNMLLVIMLPPFTCGAYILLTSLH